MATENYGFLTMFQFLLVRLQTGGPGFFIVSCSKCFNSFQLGFRLKTALFTESTQPRFNSFQLGFRQSFKRKEDYRAFSFNSFQLGFRRPLRLGLARGRKRFNSFQLGFRPIFLCFPGRLGESFQFLLVRLQTQGSQHQHHNHKSPFQFLLVRLQTTCD